MIGRTFTMALLGVVGACATPRDPFLAARAAMQRDDLIAALLAYDTVPAHDARFPAARAAAASVEQRLRHSHESLLAALRLRGQWRDEEALAVLLQAREQWAGLPGADGLIEATQRRLDWNKREPHVADPPTLPLSVAAIDGPVDEPPAPVVVSAMPVAVLPPPVLTAPPPTPSACEPPLPLPPAMVAPAPLVEPLGDSARVVEPTAPAPDVMPSEDVVGPALMNVEKDLGQGDRTRALRDLFDLAQRFPADLRVRLRLSRLLQQRALAFYGEGSVAAAIGDWQKVLELDPDNELARRSLRTARAEFERRR